MEKNGKFDKVAQLWTLISNYPTFKRTHNIKVNIYGLILDYISRSHTNLIDILERLSFLESLLFDIDSKKINPEIPHLFLLELYNDYKERLLLRKAANKNNWNNISKYIDKIDEEAGDRGEPMTNSLLDRISGHRVVGVVWQLSDLHFGKLNEIGLNPVQLAENLKLVAEFNDEIFLPRLILISGDITTKGSKEEFDQFNEFAEHLSREIWGSNSAPRILTVPGNHDVSWKEGGTADKLKAFSENVAIHKKVTTPFWTTPRKKKDDIGEITINSFNHDELEDVPPFVLVTEKQLDFQVLLLISSYYSGFVPQKIRDLLKNIENETSRKTIEKLCREDTGELSTDYIFHLKSNLRATDKTTVALIHHNLEQYGERPCQVTQKPELLSTLFEKKIHLVFHGHTHLSETQNSGRTANDGEAFPIPCPTLSSDCEPGSVHGFFMHLVGPPNNEREITTVRLDVNSSRFLNPADGRLKPIYKFTSNQISDEFKRHRIIE